MVSATSFADILRVAFSSGMARSASLACSAICGDVRGAFGGVKGTAFGLLPLLECCGVNGTAFGLLMLVGNCGSSSWCALSVRIFHADTFSHADTSSHVGYSSSAAWGIGGGWLWSNFSALSFSTGWKVAFMFGARLGFLSAGALGAFIGFRILVLLGLLSLLASLLYVILRLFAPKESVPRVLSFQVSFGARWLYPVSPLGLRTPDLLALFLPIEARAAGHVGVEATARRTWKKRLRFSAGSFQISG